MICGVLGCAGGRETRLGAILWAYLTMRGGHLKRHLIPDSV